MLSFRFERVFRTLSSHYLLPYDATRGFRMHPHRFLSSNVAEIHRDAGTRTRSHGSTCAPHGACLQIGPGF